MAQGMAQGNTALFGKRSLCSCASKTLGGRDLFALLSYSENHLRVFLTECGFTGVHKVSHPH